MEKSKACWFQVKLDLGVSARVPKSASPAPSSLPHVASLPQGGLAAPPPAGLGLGEGGAVSQAKLSAL